jgi:hypothetical protein
VNSWTTSDVNGSVFQKAFRKSTPSDPRYASPSQARGSARMIARRKREWRWNHAAIRRRTDGVARGAGVGRLVALVVVIDTRDASTRGPRWEPRVEWCWVGL